MCICVIFCPIYSVWNAVFFLIQTMLLWYPLSFQTPGWSIWPSFFFFFEFFCCSQRNTQAAGTHTIHHQPLFTPLTYGNTDLVRESTAHLWRYFVLFHYRKDRVSVEGKGGMKEGRRWAKCQGRWWVVGKQRWKIERRHRGQKYNNVSKYMELSQNTCFE